MEETVIASTSEQNIVEIVKQTINSLCESLFNAINNDVFPLLDDMVFIDSDIMKSSYMEKIFGTTATSGVIILANCLLTSFILYYCIRLMLANYTGAQIDSPYKFFIRATIAAITMNYSLSICTFMIDGTNEISSFFCYLGKDLFGKEISFVTFSNELSKTLDGNFNMFSLNGIIYGMLSVPAFSLIISFSIRYIVIKILVILSPFMVLCLINQSTSNFFKCWLKCFFSLLVLQIVVAIILLLPFAIIKEDYNSLFNKFLLVRNHRSALKIESIYQRIY